MTLTRIIFWRPLTNAAGTLPPTGYQARVIIRKRPVFMRSRTALAAAILILGAVSSLAQLSDTPGPSLDHPAINYKLTPPSDPVALLNRKLDQHQAELKSEGPSGYLRSVLAALNVPIESQIAVFSKTSLQAPLIEPHNPRTIFFNDSVAVGWMKGGFVELASLDPRQGVQFYRLDQRASSLPGFQKGGDCLRCHVGDTTLGVAGMVVRSTFTA